MLRQRFIRTFTAVALLSGTLCAATARAQSPLGFSIDPTLGVPGSTVHGQVDVDDVNAFCVTDIAEFQQRFTELFLGPFVASDTVGELPQTWFPDPNNIVYENEDQVAYVLTLLVILGISQDIEGAAQTAFPQTFVMTFADVATQEPIGELGSFDPATGVGSVTVPNLPPGLAFVAATCVGPTLDIDALREGIEESGAFLQSIGVQFGPDGPSSPEFLAWARDFFNVDIEDNFELLIFVAQQLGPSLVQNIVEFDALGLQPFTVTTFDELLSGLETSINDLIASGDLKRGHGRGLLNRLRSIRRNLGKNPPRVSSACRQLGNLIRTIERRVSRGHLSPENGDALIDQVEAIMSALGCST